jgi:hypothetical protein
MKKIILPLLLACCSALNAAEDCAKNADACSAGKKTIVSPFLAASAQPAKKAAAPAVPAKKAASAAQPVQPAAAAAPADPAAAQAPVQDAGRASSPLWLLLVGAGLAALYFYLGGKNKKGKKR